MFGSLFNKAKPHILLMVGDDGIIVVPHDIPNTSPFFTPTENKNAVQIISDFIARYPQARLSLCADNLAQDYRVETLPPLSFFDRAAIVKRRLQQNFPLARLTASQRLKKSKSQILMIGLNSTNPVLMWADRLRARLPEIILLPVEGAQLLGKLRPESATGWSMIVSHQKTGGFRQIVTHNGNLVFTRLTPLPADSEDKSSIIARDIKASLDYLTRHGLQESRELSVLLLLPESQVDISFFTNLSLNTVQCLSPVEAARLLALPFAPTDKEEADIFFAAAIMSMRPRLSLMLPDTTRVWQNKRLHFLGTRVAACCLAFSLLLATGHTIDLISTLYQISGETAYLYAEQNELAQAQSNAAPLNEPLGRLHQALARRHIYQELTPTPWRGLNQLSDGLTDDAKLVKLDWEKKDEANLEKITLSMRVASPETESDRAATVIEFTNAAQNIALTASDYDVTITKPPYPALPQESVTPETPTTSQDPTGDIVMQRKAP